MELFGRRSACPKTCTQGSTTQRNADIHQCLECKLRTHDPSVRVVKDHALESEATVKLLLCMITGIYYIYERSNILIVNN